MLWLLLLHISAVVCWCGSLLYLLALITDAASRQTINDQQRLLALASTVFSTFATPAALIAIVTGTAVFMTEGITEFWLILKLSLVIALVICHALSGWILLQTQNNPSKNVTMPCLLLGILVIILIPAIVWLVLTKPV